MNWRRHPVLTKVLGLLMVPALLALFLLALFLLALLGVPYALDRVGLVVLVLAAIAGIVYLVGKMPLTTPQLGLFWMLIAFVLWFALSTYYDW